MPTFPRIPRLPRILNPFNLRHYFLLAYWVYFRPTALHCYLHQGAPELEKIHGWRRFLQSWRYPAYRNLYLMAPIPLVLVGILLVCLAWFYVQYTIQGHDSWVNDIAVSADHRFAVTASGELNLKYGMPSGDPSLKVWDLERGDERQSFSGHGKSINAVALTSDGKFAVTASNDNTLKIWDLINNRQWQSELRHKGPVLDVVITPDNRKIISASEDKTLKIWDLEKGKEDYTLTGHTDLIRAVALTADGKQAISASEDRTLKVWDLQQGEELRTLTGHQGGVLAVTISPDNRWVISAGKDQTVRLWNLSTGTLHKTLSGHQSWVNAVAVTPDSQRVISAASDNTLKVWEIATGQLLETLEGHQGWVNAVAVTPNGERAISASSDQTVKVWDLAQGKPLYNFDAHRKWVKAVAVISDQQVISGSFERFPRMWDLQSGREVSKARFHRHRRSLLFALGIISVLIITGTVISLAVMLAIGVMVLGVPGGVATFLVVSAVAGAILSVVVVFLDRVLVHPAFQAVVFGEFVNTAVVVLFGLIFGMTFSAALSLNSRKSLGVLGSVVFTFILGVAAAIVLSSVVQRPAGSLMGPILFSQRIASQVGITFNLFVLLGAFRVVLYPFQLGWTFWTQARGQGHPVESDELLVLPLPGTRNYLCQQLNRDQWNGLERVMTVNRNPFQRSVAQAALQTYLHQSPTPLHFIYDLVRDPELETYVLPPVAPQDWQLFPTSRQVLLGQLAHQWVDCSGDWQSYLAEKWVGVLTAWCRVQRQTPLTDFAKMLYELTYQVDVNAKTFDLSVYQPIYGRLTAYGGGAEIADSFAALATFLGYERLSDIPKASYFKLSGVETPDSLIRPTVITTLVSLQKIGTQIMTAQTARDRGDALTAFVQATDALYQLDEYVITEVVGVEKALLRRIIHQWQGLVINESGRVAGECRI